MHQGRMRRNDGLEEHISAQPKGGAMTIERQKLDMIITQISDLRRIAAVNTEILKNHIKRTEIAEKRLKVVEDRVHHIDQHVTSVNTIVKSITYVIGVAGGLVALLYGISKLI